MEQQLCLIACSALGETGSLVFALIALVWGLYERRAKKQTATKVTDLEAERLRLETEIKVLSMRPPAMPAVPAFLIQPAQASSSSTPNTTSPTDPNDEPFPDERLPDERLG